MLSYMKVVNLLAGMVTYSIDAAAETEAGAERLSLEFIVDDGAKVRETDSLGSIGRPCLPELVVDKPIDKLLTNAAEESWFAIVWRVISEEETPGLDCAPEGQSLIPSMSNRTRTHPESIANASPEVVKLIKVWFPTTHHLAYPSAKFLCAQSNSTSAVNNLASD